MRLIKTAAILPVLAALCPACGGIGSGDPGNAGLTGELTFDSTWGPTHTSSIAISGDVYWLSDPPGNTVTWTSSSGLGGLGGDRLVTYMAGFFDAMLPITVHQWFATVDLAPGDNVITVTVTDPEGRVATGMTTILRGPDLPTVGILAPTSASTWTASTASITLSGTAASALGIASVGWTNDATGATGTAAGTTSWSADVALVEGTNPIRVQAVDGSGGVGTAVLTVTYTAPVLTVTLTGPSTTGSWTTSADYVQVSWQVTNWTGPLNVYGYCAESGFSQMVSGASWTWHMDVLLIPGPNTVVITAIDATNARASATVVVTKN
jgi:hypothetical protein